MIEAHFDSLEKGICGNLLVIFNNLNRTYTSPETGYIKGEIVFIDGSSLIIFQHARIERDKLVITDYRYHYMETNNRMIFRYDNAPHYPGIKTFPQHKHCPLVIEEAGMPGIEEVLAEINLNIIQKIKPY